MSKLAIYSPSIGIWGGGQIYIEQLCRYLVDRGSEAFITTCEPDTFHCATLAMADVSSRWSRLLHSFGLARELKKKGVTHILLNDLSSVWLAPVFRLAGFRVMALLHLYLQRRKENPLGHSLPEYWLIRLTSLFCYRIFSVNKENVAVLGSRVQFIGNYVPDWFFPRNSQPLRDKEYDFIFIGRFAKQKNLPLFLDLLNNLNNSSEKQYTALLVGSGSEQKKIENKITELSLTDYVCLEPWVERHQLPAVYDRGRCFIVSSFHEGFATTLLEAHARGLPAIVTRSSGFCAEFVEGGAAPTGLVFESGDVGQESFTAEVAGLIDRFQEYAPACMEKARMFDEENVLGPIADYIAGQQHPDRDLSQ